jgi:hypothetical protein
MPGESTADIIWEQDENSAFFRRFTMRPGPLNVTAIT